MLHGCDGVAAAFWVPRGVLLPAGGRGQVGGVPAGGVRGAGTEMGARRRGGEMTVAMVLGSGLSTALNRSPLVIPSVI